MSWIGVVLAIGVIILVHEGGHFFVARWCKMRVERFSIGFGPALWSKKDSRGTTFQLAPIPFGGFVQIDGMLVADDVDMEDEFSYPNRPVLQRFLTIFAGPATNYLFAIVLAFFLFGTYGLETGRWTVESVSLQKKGEDGKEVVPNGAEKLQAGDVIYSYNDTLVGDAPNMVNPVKYVNDFAKKNPNKEIVVKVLRDGKTVSFPIVPRLMKNSEGQEGFILGFIPLANADRESVGAFETIKLSFYYPIEQTGRIIDGIRQMIQGKGDVSFHGPVVIGSVIHRSFQQGWFRFLELMMLLNVSIGLFNLFPLPALDGGRLVFLGYEMVTRKRANPKVEQTVHMVGMMGLLVLMVLVTYKDCALVL